MPARKPTAAGMTDHLSIWLHIFMLGIRSDHTEAATITPEAKPSRAFCSSGGMSFFMKNTKPEPNIVPVRGMRSPKIIPSIAVLIIYETNETYVTL